MADNYQRTGSVSNAHVGRDFEQDAIRVLSECGINVSPNFSVKVGIAGTRKDHKFDLGSNSPPILVECKSHKWTSPGGNVPSAKMTVWNEAMYYFYCAPSRYRKILFVLRNERSATGETLAAYYIRTYGHLIPEGVEIWELNQDSGKCDIVWDQVFRT